jgi:hypothetical protein
MSILKKKRSSRKFTFRPKFFETPFSLVWLLFYGHHKMKSKVSVLMPQRDCSSSSNSNSKKAKPLETEMKYKLLDTNETENENALHIILNNIYSIVIKVACVYYFSQKKSESEKERNTWPDRDGGWQKWNCHWRLSFFFLLFNVITILKRIAY